MKEVIMKKILFWMVLIVGIVALIGSCAKKDDSTTAAAAGNVAGSGTTASGTIEGNSDLTGTFHTSWNGQEPSGGCVDNSSALSAHSSYLASDTKSFKKMWIITGTSSFTESEVQYSDTGCTTMTSYFNKMAANVSIGSELTSLTAGSNPAFPTSANKISYQFTKYSLMANTSNTISSFSSRFSINVTSGEEMKIDESNITTEYTILATGDMSGSTKKYLFINNTSSADNVTDWISNQRNVYWKE
jgi:hypothetical protein|tara:strand:+ start:374 stop:1108 length:735 start_codon:yes stop_codon:yes gene_type:complete